MEYLFEIVHMGDKGKLDNLFMDFIAANSVFEAREKMEKLYPIKKGYNCRFIKKQETWD